jgi:hypothetical protein
MGGKIMKWLRGLLFMTGAIICGTAVGQTQQARKAPVLDLSDPVYIQEAPRVKIPVIPSCEALKDPRENYAQALKKFDDDLKSHYLDIQAGRLSESAGKPKLDALMARLDAAYAALKNQIKQCGQDAIAAAKLNRK